MSADTGWKDLFWEAFRRSRNAMVLLDADRKHVEVNSAYLQLVGYTRQSLLGRPVYDLVVGGPMLSDREWKALILRDQFDGQAELVCADGAKVAVDLAGHPAIVMGSRLVVFVVMRTGRGGRFRSDPGSSTTGGRLSPRELEVVSLIAEGYTGREMASELQLATHTINAHVRNAMSKIDARSRAQLIAKVMGSGMWPAREDD